VSRRVDLPTLRAAVWAESALLRARYALKRRGIEHVSIKRPPPLPGESRRGVLAVLRRQPHTCLERALVLQSWEAAHGNAHDVIIGVTLESGDFTAHAWLAEVEEAGGFHELMRLPAA
jgi:hypothetical protein